MEEQVAQITVAALGIAGTLAASLWTQAFSRRAERGRRLAEDETRWLPNRLDIATNLLSKAGAVHRNLYSAASFIRAPDGPIEDRPKWLAGHMNVLATPEEGLPGILSAEDRGILIEMQFEWTDLLEAMEDLVSRVVLLATDDEATAARAMHEALWEAEGYLEIYAPGNLVYPALRAAQEAIDAYAAMARVGLRVPGTRAAGQVTV
jgi:hypothetical protein